MQQTNLQYLYPWMSYSVTDKHPYVEFMIRLMREYVSVLYEPSSEKRISLWHILIAEILFNCISGAWMKFYFIEVLV